MATLDGQIIFFHFSLLLTEGSTSSTETDSRHKLTKTNAGPEQINEKQAGEAQTQETQETQEMIKLTRKNLRPVLQPFKRGENSGEKAGAESPVDILLRQGDLRPRQGREGERMTLTDCTAL